MTNPLARVVMNSVIKKAKEDGKKTPYKGRLNLTSRDEDIISGLIRGEKSLVEKNIKSSPITLDEAASRIRKNS